MAVPMETPSLSELDAEPPHKLSPLLSTRAQPTNPPTPFITRQHLKYHIPVVFSLLHFN